MKLKFVLPILCLFGLLGGFAYQYQSVAGEKVERENAVTNLAHIPTTLRGQYNSADLTTMGRVGATADWADVPRTLRDLYDSADMIVKVTVTSSSNRLVSQTLPIHGLAGDLAERAQEVPEDILILEQGMKERGIEGTPDQLTQEQIAEILGETTLETEQIGEEVVHTPFTDSTVKILEVIKGDIAVAQEIIVFQLGGEMPALNAPDNSQNNRNVIMEFSENPLLEVETEYILFLTDSRDNTMHALGRDLYELVGPTGQFKIDAQQVHNPMNAIEHLGLPTDLDALMATLQTYSREASLGRE